MSDIILASNSPRRREMFGWLGLPFSCQTPDVDETPLVDESPMGYVSRLAVAKTRAIARQFNLLDTIVGADTIVVHNGVLLGKPTNDADANRMLTQLRGKTHQVLTAVTILLGNQQANEVCVSDVRMREFSDAELQAYVASGDPLDKAGAYAIQHAGFHPVEHFGGCMASVMGLPLCHLARAYARLGISVASPAGACQAKLNYTCPIWEQVARGDTVG